MIKIDSEKESIELGGTVDKIMEDLSDICIRICCALSVEMSDKPEKRVYYADCLAHALASDINEVPPSVRVDLGGAKHDTV